MFSLAYVVDGVPQVAVIYEPLLDKLFTATKGTGAYLNNEPVQVNDRASLNGASIGITASARQMLQREKFCTAMLDDGARLLTIPGNVFKGALVAQGRLDAYIFPGLSAHDIAAEKLIIEEAGGKVTDIDGNEQRYDQPIRGAIISNGKLHDVLVKHLANYGAEDYLGY
jgi:fructose-1,6-bisphosphatase/inositol monophosphatase family enzyme